jgi:peptidoglycan/xylan/chitin deacetylase (PgdA/CDA1 family)
MTEPVTRGSASGESPGVLVNRRHVLLAIGGLALTTIGGSAVLDRYGPRRPRALRPTARRAATGDPASTAAYRDAAEVELNQTTAAIRRALSGVQAADARELAYPTDRPLYHIADDPRGAIALTIDDGPSPVYTPQILQLLQQYRVTASFSMIGIQVNAYPQVAREVVDAGHRVMNHTWTHANLPALAAPDIFTQMTRASDVIHSVTGVQPSFFRAPYGNWSPTVIEQCERMHMIPLDWSVDPRDWARPGVASIVDNIMQNTRPGSIILEHDGGGDRSETVAALRIVLPRLLAAGFKFQSP